jgi:hypothetical protein
VAKYGDTRSLGRSQRVPFKRGESAPDRHERRRRAAVEAEQRVKAWGEMTDTAVHVTNGGHHWTFIHDEQIAEWWPSSGKLVFERKYQKGVHAHDVEQVIQEIVRRWT